MNHKEVTAILEKMTGKTYSYGNQIHYVKDYKIDEDSQKCSIITNLNTYDRKFESLREFISYWTPISSISANLETPKHYDLLISIQQEEDLSKSLIDTLNDSIAKVQKSKDYIPQAQCVNNNINTIVNIAKMRLSYIKQFKTHLKGGKYE